MQPGARAKHKQGRSSAHKEEIMPTWSVSVRMPVVVYLEIEADTQEEAEDQALQEADHTAGEVDGAAEIVETEEVES